MRACGERACWLCSSLPRVVRPARARTEQAQRATSPSATSPSEAWQVSAGRLRDPVSLPGDLGLPRLVTGWPYVGFDVTITNKGQQAQPFVLADLKIQDAAGGASASHRLRAVASRARRGKPTNRTARPHNFNSVLARNPLLCVTRKGQSFRSRRAAQRHNCRSACSNPCG